MKTKISLVQLSLIGLGGVAIAWPFFVKIRNLNCWLGSGVCSGDGSLAWLLTATSIIVGSFLCTFAILGVKKGYALPVVVSAVTSGLVYYIYFAVTLRVLG